MRELIQRIQLALRDNPAIQLKLTYQDGRTEVVSDLPQDTQQLRMLLRGTTNVEILAEETAPTITYQQSLEPSVQPRDPYALLYQRDAQYAQRELSKAEARIEELRKKKADWKKKALAREKELTELRHRQELDANATPTGLGAIMSSSKIDKIIDSLSPGLEKLGLGFAQRIIEGQELTHLSEEQKEAIRAMSEWFAAMDEDTQQYWWNLFSTVSQASNPAQVIAGIFQLWERGQAIRKSDPNQNHDGLYNGTEG